MPPWLSSLHDDSSGAIGDGNIEESEAPNAPLRIGDGASAAGESDGDMREAETDEISWGDGREGVPEPDGGWEGEGWGGRGSTAGDVDGRGGAEEWGGGHESWGEGFEENERHSEELSGIGSAPVRGSDSRVRRREEEVARQGGGALRQTTMLDLLEGNIPSEVEARGDGGGGLLEGDVAFPPNMEGVMEEMRVLAQKDLDRKQRRHKHEPVDADGEEDEEEEGDWDEEGSDWDEAVGREDDDNGMEVVAGQDPEEQAREALKQMLVDTPLGRAVDSSQAAAGGSNVANAVAARDEDSLDANDERDDDDDDDEYEDWTPLMHEGIRGRTEALLGVVEVLEADAMEAARRADAAQGRRGGRGARRGAGSAVQATLRARLRVFTESHRCTQAIRFVEEEYPKEVRQWGEIGRSFDCLVSG